MVEQIARACGVTGEGAAPVVHHDLSRPALSDIPQVAHGIALTRRRLVEVHDAFRRPPVRGRMRGLTVEIDDPAIGAQVLARGSFAGVTYDSHDQRVEIMIGDASEARHHVMHSVPGVESVALTVNESPAREVLELRHGHGHTLVLIDQ